MIDRVVGHLLGARRAARRAGIVAEFGPLLAAGPRRAGQRRDLGGWWLGNLFGFGLDDHHLGAGEVDGIGVVDGFLDCDHFFDGLVDRLVGNLLDYCVDRLVGNLLDYCVDRVFGNLLDYFVDRLVGNLLGHFVDGFLLSDRNLLGADDRDLTGQFRHRHSLAVTAPAPTSTAGRRRADGSIAGQQLGHRDRSGAVL